MLNVGKYRNKSKCSTACLRDEFAVPPPPLSTLNESPFSNRAAYLFNIFHPPRKQTIIRQNVIDNQFGRIAGTGGMILNNFR